MRRVALALTGLGRDLAGPEQLVPVDQFGNWCHLGLVVLMAPSRVLPDVVVIVAYGSAVRMGLITFSASIAGSLDAHAAHIDRHRESGLVRMSFAAYLTQS